MGKIIKEIDLSGDPSIPIDPNWIGKMTFDGKVLWLSAEFDETLIKMDRQGNIIRRFTLPNMEADLIGGLVFDGMFFWGQSSNAILYKFDRQGNEIKRIDLTALNPVGNGLGYNGKHLQVVDIVSDEFYTIDFEGRHIHTTDISSSGGIQQDIAFDGKTNLLANSADRNVQTLSKDGAIVKTTPVPAWANRIYGNVYDGKYLWVCDDITDTVALLSR